MLLVESLSVAYGQSRVLFDITMDVQDGQVVCLMGRNGVGKTTLLKSIMGLLRPRAGKVSFFDENLTNLPPHRRARSGIGYVPQGRLIFPFLSVYENLLMGLEGKRKNGKGSNDKGNDDKGNDGKGSNDKGNDGKGSNDKGNDGKGSNDKGSNGKGSNDKGSNGKGSNDVNEDIEEMYSLFPALKLNPSKNAGTLSGGQQQQLAFARAMIRHPRLLLLDEPTEGLQPSIIQEIEDLIISLRERRDTSILLVEQSLDFALGVADHCFLMEKGEIVLEGATNTLDQNLMRDYLAV